MNELHFHYYTKCVDQNMRRFEILVDFFLRSEAEEERAIDMAERRRIIINEEQERGKVP